MVKWHIVALPDYYNYRKENMTQTLGWSGWLVIALYGVGMIVIGYRYMRCNKSADDFNLGNRSMKSGIVGLSLFATMLSAISYLAIPGEIINYGPLYFGYILALPVVYYLVGWFIIPHIMRLKISSAYEILELRFNSSLRTLSSILFLVLRLLWMSVVIYATTDKVLIPVLGLSQDIAPLLGAIIGIITLVYASLGGIRAVVVTDAIQSFILFGGALLVLLLITMEMGGIDKWWPHHWSDHWAVPQWGFQLSKERTLGWFIISPLIWYLCTNSSDQMSIQRFLSTRNTKAARQVLGTSLLANIIVGLFLGILGFALLGYSCYNTNLLKAGQSVYTHADQLLPQYIIMSLPPWISGILIAGLMAAAMSSLSSGINSSSAVIIEDFINRFRKKKFTGNSKLRITQLISLFAGILVVVMSLFVYVVPGNLLEVTYRVSNLFTVPLFIMFFMALFIPWATVFGTWIATLSSAGVAVLISFWENIFSSQGPGFLYIMPAALVTGVLVGIVFSLLPIGVEPKPMLSKNKND